jgi:hypothetical protein
MVLKVVEKRNNLSGLLVPLQAVQLQLLAATEYTLSHLLGHLRLLQLMAE